jgi:hypothetical protein
MISQDSGAIPDEFPDKYTFSPTSTSSNSISAPAALRIDNVAFMISGPIPSPFAIVILLIIYFFFPPQISNILFIKMNLYSKSSSFIYVYYTNRFKKLNVVTA